MNSNKYGYRAFLLFLVIFVTFACQQTYTPKPHAYFRIDFPEKEYRLFDSIYPFTFEYPVYGIIKPDNSPTAEPGWINIRFPAYKGIIHLTYKKVEGNFDVFIENEWTMLYKVIAQKADAIDDYPHFDEVGNVYGMMNDVKGNAASPVRFFVTDSVRHFLRGSLYFETRPNYDSLAPAIDFFREDIAWLMKTVKWKDIKSSDW